MPIVKAGPNEYLLIGRNGRVENRGSAVQLFLRPGTIHVLVPSTKQEAAFEFTQETSDGIPLRFKGIVIYRISDPVAAARLFDFAGGAGIAQVTALITHVVLGELRHAVSGMTMVECIEQRKTTLSGVVEAALRGTIGADGSDDGWGVAVEVAQVAQVFIVDTELRRQLEAEVRNQIKLTSDHANLRAQEENRLAEMASEGRVQEQKLAGDRERLRREEELGLVRLAHERRMQAEQLVTERQALQLQQERFRAEMEAEQDRLTVRAPVRRLEIETEAEILGHELAMRRLQNQVAALETERELLLPRARQELRREILPVEQAPRIVEAASKVLQGANLSLYGESAQVLGQLAPVLDIVGRAVRQAVPEAPQPAAPRQAG